MITPKHAIFLVDGSGSMAPAWFEAWGRLFQKAKEQPHGFSMLLFKQPRYLTPAEADAVVDTDNRHYAIVDVAAVVRAGGLVRLKRAPSPQELGITFRGRTPLLAAIKLARANYPSADLTVYVVSDNRDSMILRDGAINTGYGYSDADVVAAKMAHRVRLVLVPVGQVLRRYLEKYDAVEDNASRDTDVHALLSLI